MNLQKNTKMRKCLALLLIVTFLFGSVPIEPIFALDNEESFESQLNVDKSELGVVEQEDETSMSFYDRSANYDSIYSVYEYDEYGYREDHVTEVDEHQEEINIEEYSNIIATGTVGSDGALWTLDADGVVRVGAGAISGTGIFNQSPWHAHRDSIREIIFTAPVVATSDLSALFSNFSHVTLIEGLAFIDTSNVTNMSRMFQGTSGLTSLDLSSFNTSSVTNMSFMFLETSGLTSLDVSNFDTSSVTNMGSMFLRASGLTSLDVSNFDTSNVTNMSDMFRETSGLTSLDLSSFNTSSVTSMSFMFWFSNGLTSLDLSSFDTSSVTNMQHMFNGTSMLQRLVLGSDFSFLGNPGLLNVQVTSEFTGYWQNVGGGSVENPIGDFVLTSAELMDQFDGSTMADTFVWQRYEKVEPEPVYRTVTFLWNHADAPGNGIITTASVREGSPIAESTEPTREEYEFVRWTTDPAGEYAWNFESPIMNNLRFYAQWEAIEARVVPPVQEWTVTFMDGERVVAVQTVEHELLLDEPEALEREGYVFEGWYHEHDEDTPLFIRLPNTITQRRWDFENDRVLGDITLQARWVEEDNGLITNPDGVTPHPIPGVNPIRSGLPQTGAIVGSIALGGIILATIGLAVASKKKR